MSERSGGLQWMADYYHKSMETKFCAKILWGSRSIYRHDWIAIKKFIAEHAQSLNPPYIYLHDKRPEEVEMMQDWKPIPVGKYTGHFFGRTE